MTTEYTATLRLAKPEFRSPNWGPLMNVNMDAIDAGITNAILASNIELWANDTAYSIATITMDDQVTPPTYWICSVAHTSPASPTTFATYRAANPTHWTSITFGITPRGEWDNDEEYGYYDIAYDSLNGIVGLCLIPHTSNSAGDMGDDAANWVFIVDMPSVGTTPAVSVSFDNTNAALPGSPTNVQTALEALDTRVDNAATVVSGIATDLDTAEADIDLLQSNYASLSSTQTTIINDVDTLESQMTTAQSDINDLEDTVSGLGVGFPASTAMIFFQASAPTGWTKSTTHNDKAIRVVSGTGGGSGGNNSFSSTFSKTTTDAKTLTTTEIPAHTHSYNDSTTTGGPDGGGGGVGGPLVSDVGRTTGSNGSGGSHTHPMDIRVNYIDVIVCTKD